jgi:hypothetical protein
MPERHRILGRLVIPTTHPKSRPPGRLFAGSCSTPAATVASQRLFPHSESAEQPDGVPVLPTVLPN